MALIDVYQEPTETNPTVAFTWSDFKQFKLYMKDQKFENVPTALKFLEDHKCWILISCFEEFRLYYEDAVKEHPVEDASIPSVVTGLREACISMIQHKENYSIILQTIEEKINFMRILVKATPQEYFPVMKMMATRIITYVRQEIDERQKNKDQAQDLTPERRSIHSA